MCQLRQGAILNSHLRMGRTVLWREITFFTDHNMHLNAFLKGVFCQFLSPLFPDSSSLLSADSQGRWLQLLQCVSCSAHSTIIQFSDCLTRLAWNVLGTAYWQAWVRTTSQTYLKKDTFIIPDPAFTNCVQSHLYTYICMHPVRIQWI